MYPRANQSPCSISLITKKRSTQGSAWWCPPTRVGKAPNKPSVLLSSRSLYPLPRPTATHSSNCHARFFLPCHWHCFGTRSQIGRINATPNGFFNVGGCSRLTSFRNLFTCFDQLWHVFSFDCRSELFSHSRLYTWSYACIHVYLVCSYFAFLLARTGCSGRP